MKVKPGFPFCLPRMAPLYTRGPPSPRNFLRRTIVQLRRPSPQLPLTRNRLEPLLSGHSSDTAPHSCSSSPSGFVALAARQPAGKSRSGVSGKRVVGCLSAALAGAPAGVSLTAQVSCWLSLRSCQSTVNESGMRVMRALATLPCFPAARRDRHGFWLRRPHGVTALCCKFVAS